MGYPKENDSWEPAANLALAADAVASFGPVFLSAAQVHVAQREASASASGKLVRAGLARDAITSAMEPVEIKRGGEDEVMDNDDDDDWL